MYKQCRLRSDILQPLISPFTPSLRFYLALNKTTKFLLPINTLPLCIPETPKQVFLQPGKTLMKCSIMLHFIRVCTVCKGEKNLQFLKNTLFFANYNLKPLDMYSGLSQVHCIKPERRIHLYTREDSLVYKGLTLSSLSDNFYFIFLFSLPIVSFFLNVPSLPLCFHLICCCKYSFLQNDESQLEHLFLYSKQNKNNNSYF